MMNLINYSPRNLYLKWKVKRDREFLLREGLRRANEQGLEIQVADEYVIDPKEKRGAIYLPPEENRRVDVIPLIQLGAEEHPEIAGRWLKNRRRLSVLMSSET